MKIEDINKIDNNEAIVLLPKEDYDIKEMVLDSFKNVFFLNYNASLEESEILTSYINKNHNMLILFDYDDFYRLILPHIHKSNIIKWVYKEPFAMLTGGFPRAILNNIFEFYDRDIINEIGCLDYAGSKVLEKAGYNVSFLALDQKKYEKENNKNLNIGIIGDDYNPNHNVYNELSAVKLVDYDFVKIISTMPATKHFIKFFEIKAQECKTLDEVVSGNNLNLYCNFTAINKSLILKSMDKGIPCLVGNTDFFDNNKVLKKYLVLNSDDSIDEISEKILLILENKDKILKEYQKFRDEYIKISKESIKNFTNK